MSTKPSSFSLAGDSKDFVFSNGTLLKKTILIFFPMILGLAVLGMVGKNLQWPGFPHVLMVPYFLVYGCYVLSWHRSALVGDGEAHIVTPFRLGKSDLVFLGFFMLLSGALSALILGVDWLARMYATQNLSTMTQGKGQALFAATLIADLIFVYVFMRLSFILPAQSVGHTLKFKDVMTSSRGMVWRLIGADFIFFVLLGVLVFVYSSVSLQIVGAAVATATETSMTTQIAIAAMAAAPIQIMILIMFALVTTALSKAYRWGIENNLPS